MAKLSSIQKNLNRLKLIKKFNNKRKSLKESVMKKNLSIEDRLKFQNKLNDLPKAIKGNVYQRKQKGIIIIIYNLK